MIREFLYVDADKVRSLLAQLDGGVDEEVKVTEKDQKKLHIGLERFAGRDRDWGTEESTQRSLADAVFPTLEDAMESGGYLRDLSEELQDADYWVSDRLRREVLPGAFVRITAPGVIFDARYVAKIWAGVASAASGFLALYPDFLNSSSSGSRTGRASKPKDARAGVTEPQIEDQIPDLPLNSLLGDFDAAQMRAWVKLARGLFHPGLHLALSPVPEEPGRAVTVRLQEGRRYLDSDAEVMFSRYGIEAQDWTVVGTVGSFPSKIPPTGRQADWNIAPGGSHVNRVITAQMINTSMALVADTGLADVCQYPSFSVVPFAVYRPIVPAAGRVVGVKN